MEIRRFLHKGLRKLYEENSAKGLPKEAVGKLRLMLSFLQDMNAQEELYALPSWRAHQLSGDRRGVWSLHVTRNWRLTFKIEKDEITDVDFEDYH